jgi:ATP-dependent exoDNAse (exonuclease V) beta subunit
VNKSKPAPNGEPRAGDADAPAPANSPRLAIQAAAGTGKTHALMVRYLRLVAAGAAPEEILATTFTRKAAGEILGRIVERLAEAVLGPKDRALLEKHLELPLPEPVCRRLFDRIVDRIDAVRIGTLDSVFANAAQRYALDLGLPPAWTILEAQDDAALRRAAIDDVLADLGPAAATEIAHYLSPGEVERSVHRQIDEVVADLHELYVESTEEAWYALPRLSELTTRDVEALADRLERAELPKDARFEKARSADLELIRSARWEEFVERGFSKAAASGRDAYYNKPIPDDVVEIYRRLNLHARAFLQNRVADRAAAMHRILRAFHDRYRRRQWRARGFRFSDVTQALAPRGLFDESSPPRALVEQARDVRHLLIDEFQDTSLAQWQALEPLARECLDRRSGTFFCVGDPQQAIYGWRGGVAELSAALDQRLGPFERSGLAVNRRSSQVVVDAVNQIFSSLSGNPALQDDLAAAEAWSTRFQVHKAYHADRDGYVRLVVAPSRREDEKDEDATLRFAADEIRRLHDESAGATIGVLVRKNKVVARMIVELRRRGVPASEEGGNSLRHSAAASVVLSFLSWLDHPGDSASRFHVARSPLGEAVGLTPDPSEVDDAATAHFWRAALARDGCAATIRRLVERFSPKTPAREQDRLERLVELAIRFEERASMRPIDFVRFVEESKVGDAAPAPVRVMTIHQAKGLQFDVVVLPDLDDRLRGQSPQAIVRREDPAGPATAVFPYVKAELQDLMGGEVQRACEDYWTGVVVEELCALYVATTRPRFALHMIVAADGAKAGAPPKTSAGVLRGALAPTAPAVGGALLFEAGRADWRSRVRLEQDAEGRPPTTLEIPRFDAPEGRTVRTAPSRIKESAENVVAGLLQTSETPSLRRGSVFHEWLAAIRWIEDGPPDRDVLLRIAQSRRPGDPGLEDLWEEFRERLGRPAVRAALSRSALPDGGLEVWTERPLLVRIDRSLVRGKIDRLVVARAGGRVVRALVVDFKTDRISNPAEVAERAQAYAPQVRAYRQAVARMFRLPLDQVLGRLVFVEVGESADVD